MRLTQASPLRAVRPAHALRGIFAAERSRQTGAASERIPYHGTERFGDEGMENL